jgi:hypothetical protein
MLRTLTILFTVALCGFATGALADPCEAISADGRLPSYLKFGTRFSGPVVRVIEG